MHDREGHRTDLFEIICRDCGDHPYLDYEGIPPRLQRIRGPYTLEAGLEAYDEHVGLPKATPHRPPDQPGHGQTAKLRRQPFRLVDGRVEGGYTDVFEVICPSCGDDPDLDYSEIPPWLQHLRGPHPLKEGLAIYLKHIGE